MRSSERARDLGEVFTPEKTVNEMLDLLQDINYASKFLEPGCGSGNFLVEILSRKMEMVTRLPEVTTALKSGRLAEYEFKAVIALASIYGIDIDPLNIEEARERDSIGVHAADRGLDGFAHHALVDCISDHGRRRVGTHAARVRALIAVLQALVILAGGQRQDVLAVAKHNEAGLFAKQAVFDDDARARSAECAVAEHGVDGRVGLVQGHGVILSAPAEFM